MTGQQQAGETPVDDQDAEPQPGDTNNPAPQPGESPPADEPQQPPPPVPPQPGGNTASLDLAAVRAEAAQGALAHAVRMIRLCASARMPTLAAEFLEKGVTIETAGERLVARMAAAQAGTATSTAHAAVPAVRKAVPVPNPTDVYAARARAVGRA